MWGLRRQVNRRGRLAAKLQVHPFRLQPFACSGEAIFEAPAEPAPAPGRYSASKEQDMTDHKKKGDFDQARKHDVGGNKKQDNSDNSPSRTGNQNAGHGGRD
jgi:hypothetical protein